MKFINLPTLIVIPFFAVTVKGQQKQGCLYNDPSFTGFSIEGQCNIGSLLNAVKERINGRTDCLNKKKELQFLFQMKNWADVESQVAILCSKGTLDNFDEVTFQDILELEDDDGDKDRFLKEFYDGGTRFNTEYDSSESGNSLADDTQSIKDAEDIIKSSTVSWPEEISNFENCDYNTIMCCYIQDRQSDGNGGCNDGNCIDKSPSDNTDLCYVDHERSPGSNHVEGGFTVFDDAAINGGEGRAHCHGFAWSTDDMHTSARHKGNNLFYVTLFDHLHTRGYVRNVPGAPMCGCIEKMPTVSRADCTQVEEVDTIQLNYDKGDHTFTAQFTNTALAFEKCDGDEKKNDLASHLRLGQERGLLNKPFPSDHLVGTCADATSRFLDAQGVTRI